MILSNAIGVFVFRDKNIVDKILYKSGEERKQEQRLITQLTAKYPHARVNPSFIFPKYPEFFRRFYSVNFVDTKKDLQNSVKKDNMIIHCINSIDELTKAINLLVKRLREWYGLYFPELHARVSNNEAFARLVVQKDKELLMQELKVTESLGGKIAEEDLAIIKQFAEKISLLVKQKEENEEYLHKLMDEYCPNLQAVANTLLAGQLIAHTGSLKKLAEYPSSTIQILGAEKAIFRHMKTKASSPKHGLIVNHPLLASARASEKGKIARNVAAALSKAARVDYFKGDKNIGKKLRDDLEVKFHRGREE